MNQVTDITDLKDGETYYVLHQKDEFPTKKVVNFSTMEEFFEKLESKLINPSKRKAQLLEVKSVFDRSDIELDTLMTLNMMKLEKLGLTLGLNEKIIAVINNKLWF